MKQWSVLLLLFLAYPLIGMQPELPNEVAGFVQNGFINFAGYERLHVDQKPDFSTQTYASLIQEQLSRAGGIIFARTVIQRGNNPEDARVQYLEFKTFKKMIDAQPVSIAVPFNMAGVHPVDSQILEDARWASRNNSLVLDNRMINHIEPTTFFLVRQGDKEVRCLGTIDELNASDQLVDSFYRHIEAYYESDCAQKIQAQSVLAHSLLANSEYLAAQKLFERLAAQNNNPAAQMRAKFEIAKMQYNKRIHVSGQETLKLFQEVEDQEIVPDLTAAARFAKARIFHYGMEGVTPDLKKAYTLYILTAGQNTNQHIKQGAQLGLGIMYLHGHSGKKDPEQARAWLELAMRGSDRHGAARAEDLLNQLPRKRSVEAIAAEELSLEPQSKKQKSPGDTTRSPSKDKLSIS